MARKPSVVNSSNPKALAMGYWLCGQPVLVDVAQAILEYETNFICVIGSSLKIVVFSLMLSDGHFSATIDNVDSTK